MCVCVSVSVCVCVCVYTCLCTHVYMTLDSIVGQCANESRKLDISDDILC